MYYIIQASSHKLVSIVLGHSGGLLPIQSKNMILIRKLKISEPVFRKWEIKIYVLMFHPVFMGGGDQFILLV